MQSSAHAQQHGMCIATLRRQRRPSTSTSCSESDSTIASVPPLLPSLRRYFSGFFFDHPLLEGFDWYWRVEPEVDFMCQVVITKLGVE